jgi:exonuclease VII small subunit
MEKVNMKELDMSEVVCELSREIVALNKKVGELEGMIKGMLLTRPAKEELKAATMSTVSRYSNAIHNLKDR